MLENKDPKSSGLHVRHEHKESARKRATPRSSSRLNQNPPWASVVDLFCGAGALSHGFLLEGFSIACGYDIDEACRHPFEFNNQAPFVRNDVSKIVGDALSREFAPNLPKVLIGCAPCQPFSRYSQGREDPKWQLLNEFANLATRVSPDIISMENVPQLVKFKGGSVFARFISQLEADDYNVRWTIADCTEFGVPQARSRLVLIGSKLGIPELPTPTNISQEAATVRDAISQMPPLRAGEVDKNDPLHRASAMSQKNLHRIQASKPGGTWRDWDSDLITVCHKKGTGRGYTSVYGRMLWDQPSPTVTTQFFGFGSGRFGHPEQDRALSLREGAMLQSFPRNYSFVCPNEPIHIKTVGRLIGNAVPVLLARAIARAVISHLREHQR